jgi:hypothetical protein
VTPAFLREFMKEAVFTAIAAGAVDEHDFALVRRVHLEGARALRRDSQKSMERTEFSAFAREGARVVELLDWSPGMAREHVGLGTCRTQSGHCVISSMLAVSGRKQTERRRLRA